MWQACKTTLLTLSIFQACHCLWSSGSEWCAAHPNAGNGAKPQTGQRRVRPAPLRESIRHSGTGPIDRKWLPNRATEDSEPQCFQYQHQLNAFLYFRINYYLSVPSNNSGNGMDLQSNFNLQSLFQPLFTVMSLFLNFEDRTCIEKLHYYKAFSFHHDKLQSSHPSSDHTRASLQL